MTTNKMIETISGDPRVIGYQQAVMQIIKIIQPMTENKNILLHGGEMTAQELRSVKAITNMLLTQVSDLLPPLPPEHGPEEVRD